MTDVNTDKLDERGKISELMATVYGMPNGNG